MSVSIKPPKIGKSKTHEHSEEELDSALSVALGGMEDEQILKSAGIYYIYGEIQQDGLKDLHQSILVKHFLGPKHFNQDIVLIINSPGGSVDASNALLDLLSNIRMDIRTVGVGTCASAAAMLLASGTKGKRVIGESTSVMIHPYSWYAIGKHQELVAHRDIQNATYKQEVDFWIKHSKFKTQKDVEKYLLRKEDTWLTPKQALKYGIVDSIGDSLR